MLCADACIHGNKLSQQTLNLSKIDINPGILSPPHIFSSQLESEWGRIVVCPEALHCVCMFRFNFNVSVEMFQVVMITRKKISSFFDDFLWISHHHQYPTHCNAVQGHQDTRTPGHQSSLRGKGNIKQIVFECPACIIVSFIQCRDTRTPGHQDTRALLEVKVILRKSNSSVLSPCMMQKNMLNSIKTCENKLKYAKLYENIS